MEKLLRWTRWAGVVAESSRYFVVRHVLLPSYQSICSGASESPDLTAKKRAQVHFGLAPNKILIFGRLSLPFSLYGYNASNIERRRLSLTNYQIPRFQPESGMREEGIHLPRQNIYVISARAKHSKVTPPCPNPTLPSPFAITQIFTITQDIHTPSTTSISGGWC